MTFTSACAGHRDGPCRARPRRRRLGAVHHRRPTASRGNSGDATKVFQDANIQITPNGTNRVGDSHTFTAHVNADLGDGGGFVNAPDGTVITFTIDATAPPRLPTRRPVHHRGWHRVVHDDHQLADDRHVDGVGSHDLHHDSGGVVLTRDTNGVGRQLRPGRQDLGQRPDLDRAQRDQRDRPPHTFTVDPVEGHGDRDLRAAAGETVTSPSPTATARRQARPDRITGTTDAAGQFAVTFTSASPAR